MDIRNDGRPVVSFAKLKPVMPMPNLLDVQLRSFEKLIEADVAPEDLWDFGLDRVFGEIFAEIAPQEGAERCERPKRLLKIV